LSEIDKNDCKYKALVNGDIFTGKSFKKGTVFIKNNKISKVVFKKIAVPKKYQIIDCTDKTISYGFCDPHVHFRSPGMEYKEDWQSGSKSAIKGGFTYVIDMPNTKPPSIDFNSILEKHKLAKNNSVVNYGFHIGLTSKNYHEIKNIYRKCLKHKIPVHGVKVFFGSSTGDLFVNNADMIERSMNSGVIHLFHAEDEEVIRNFSSIEYKSVQDHNIRRPPEAELSAIKKIYSITKKVKKTRSYFCHISTKNGLKFLLSKKNKKIITEVTPHHLYFFTDNISESNIFKVNPPIREYQDVLFLRKLFNKNKISVIGTDHAPHLLSEKLSDSPPSGLPGLETALVSLLSLAESGILKKEIIFKMLTNGYNIFNIKNRGSIKKNFYADISIISKKENTYSVKNSMSKCDFSPFDNVKFNNIIDMVIIGGKILLKDGIINE